MEQLLIALAVIFVLGALLVVTGLHVRDSIIDKIERDGTATRRAMVVSFDSNVDRVISELHRYSADNVANQLLTRLSHVVAHEIAKIPQQINTPDTPLPPEAQQSGLSLETIEESDRAHASGTVYHRRK